jgi:protein TonB
VNAKKTKFLNQPEYPGGPKALTTFIYQHLKYPQTAWDANIEGIVLLEYDINNKGKVIETRVLQSLSPECDEEAKRVIALLRFDVPVNRGLRVVFHKKIQVHFKKAAPAPQEAVPQPTASMQMTYTIVPAAPVPPKTEEMAPPPAAQQTYSYWINI